jgi:ketosteroid isomerase-like protein
MSACLVAAAGVGLLHASFAATPGKTEQAISQVEQDWCAAMDKGDATALAGILADDCLEVALTGAIENKAQSIADLKTDKTTACKTDALQIRVYGDTAIAIGRTHWVTAVANLNCRFTDVYVRSQDRWLCVSSQASESRKN